jgi:hypothetical protein
MVEVTNGKKYAELQAKRSRWQHVSRGKNKATLLMTYENEDVAANHTCVLEVWKTARRATPKDPWEFPVLPLGISLDGINRERQEVIDAASATQKLPGSEKVPYTQVYLFNAFRGTHINYWVYSGFGTTGHSRSPIPTTVSRCAQAIGSERAWTSRSSATPNVELHIDLQLLHAAIKEGITKTIKSDIVLNVNDGTTTPPHKRPRFPGDPGECLQKADAI